MVPPVQKDQQINTHVPVVLEANEEKNADGRGRTRTAPYNVRARGDTNTGFKYEPCSYKTW